MSSGTIVLLGAFAGLTIFLGFPLAFLKHLSLRWKAFLSMLATGVLLFLLYDVIQKASDPITTALTQMHTHQTGANLFILDVLLLTLGIGIGSVGLVYFNHFVFGRARIVQTTPVIVVADTAPVSDLVLADATRHALPDKTAPRAVHVTEQEEMPPQTLALLIATGIGLHNFSEGLAIGQSAAVGALQLAIVLVVGFGLHNMTEGFGIAGPLTGQRVSWKFLILLGLIGGGPTFLGTIVGIIFTSPQVFILFLALAAGAIIYVITELLSSAKKFRAPDMVMWGLFIGFLLGYATDLIVTFGGA